MCLYVTQYSGLILTPKSGLGGPHVLIYETTFWTHFDPKKWGQHVPPKHEQHSLSLHGANTHKQD
jgi:hypothetical protein